MQPPAGSIHVLGLHRIIKGKKLPAQLLGVLRLDTGFRTFSKELLNPTVPKALYHPSGV